MEIQEGVEQWVEQIKAKRAAEKFWLGPGSLAIPRQFRPLLILARWVKVRGIVKISSGCYVP